RLQFGQVRSESTMQPTATRSPGLYLVTAEPTFVTRPTISWPGTIGYTVGMNSLHSLRTECRSEWQMPQKRISICTSRSVGSRRLILVDASPDVGLAAQYAFALYVVGCMLELLLSIKHRNTIQRRAWFSDPVELTTEDEKNAENTRGNVTLHPS